jgi:hypothetical protein
MELLEAVIQLCHHFCYFLISRSGVVTGVQAVIGHVDLSRRTVCSV